MPRGANAKREREYQQLERQFKRQGRYRGREEEVAARIVNKQRAAHGETAPQRHQPVKRSASRRKSRAHRRGNRRQASHS